MALELIGKEERTLELDGTVDAEAARRLLGPSLQPVLREGRAEVSLLLFQMHGLRLRGVPGPAFDYQEALWRIRVERAGGPAWFAVACDLDHVLIRVLGALLVRYPVRTAQFQISDRADGSTFAVADASGRQLVVAATPQAETLAATPPLPMLVRARGQLYRIPWREEPAPWRQAASCVVEEGALAEDLFGPTLRWDSAGRMHRGRIHKCGIARRVRD